MHIYLQAVGSGPNAQVRDFVSDHAILLVVGPVDALYENGVLRPVSPLPLRSGERVAVIVVRRADPSRWNVARLGAHDPEDDGLAEAGLGDWSAALDHEDRG